MNGQFPNSRLRRTRQFPWSRNLVRENQLTTDNFIWATFIEEGSNIKKETQSMHDVFIYSIDRLIDELKQLISFGLNAIMLFPKIPVEKKSMHAEEAYNSDNLICQAIKKIKNRFPSLGIITDIALDAYTINGHDGVTDENEYVLNDETTKILCKQALNFANAGCDIIAPSDMMDGRIGEIRKYLDENNYQNVQIMSYAVKFSSSFYNPFRESTGSVQKKPIDKSTYQLDYANSKEAMREIEQDINEGADYIIIKPAMLYLDIICEAKNKFNIPLIAYNVSGEYALAMNSIQNNLFDKYRLFNEVYISMKRAGVDIIITYNFRIIIDLYTKNK